MVVCFILILIFTAISEARQSKRCPNSCSNHGDCTHLFTCRCHTGYTGADCSQRSCPYDASWASKPYALDAAHVPMECSNQGLCDRNTGHCRCFPGFEGATCAKATCGIMDCGSRGTCLSIDQIYKIYKSTDEADIYSMWDFGHTTACVCDMGYTGANCETVLCPKGDDPLTVGASTKSIVITTGAAEGSGFGPNTGKFLFQFNGHSLMFPSSPYLWSESQCQAAVEGLANVKSATCTQGGMGPGGGTSYTIVFHKFSTMSRDNNIYNNDGSYSTWNMSCLTTMIQNANNPYCRITDASVNPSIKEYSICSNRGRCITSTGVCDCYINFWNSNCDSLKIMPNSRAVALSQNTLKLTSTRVAPDFYSSSIFRIASTNIENTTYNILYADDYFGETVLHMNNAGFFRTRGSWTVKTGATLNYGGLTLTSGFSVLSGGLSVNHAVIVDLKVDILGGAGADINEGVTIHSDGLSVTNGISINTWGLVVTGGVNVFTGGLGVQKGGFTVTGGFTVNSGGLRLLKGGCTIRSNGLTVTGGMSTASGLSPIQSFTVFNLGMKVTGGMTVYNLGLKLTNGFTIFNSGMNIVTRGVSIGTGGLIVTGGMTVFNSNLFISGGITVENSAGIFVSAGGFRVTNGMSVTKNGLLVTGGVSVAGNGMRLVGDCSVNTGGVALASSLSVQASGLHILNNVELTGILTVNSGGLIVTSGITLFSNGLVVTHGISVMFGGVAVITDGASINSNGATVTNGLTIHSGGLKIVTGTAPSLNVNTGGIISTSGIQVNSVGLRVSGGLTINTGGVSITGGLTMKSGGGIILSTISVVANGFKVIGGISVDAGIIATSATVDDLVVSEGSTVNFDGVSVIGSATVFNSGIVMTGGVTVQNKGLKVSGGVSVRSEGIFISGGLTIFNSVLYHAGLGKLKCDSGFLVSAGGMTVLNGGLEMVGNLDVSNGFAVNEGMTIAASGLRLTGGLSVTDRINIDSGLSIFTLGFKVDSSGRLTIIDGGLIIPASGLTIGGNGLKVESGFSARSAGLIVRSSDLTVLSNGFILSGGLSLSSRGVNVADVGATINFHGAIISGGISILSGGVSLLDGLTVSSGGSTISTKTVISSGGAAIASLSVSSGGLSTDGAFKVPAQGMRHLSGSTTLFNVGLSVTGGVTTDMFMSTVTHMIVADSGVTYRSQDRVEVSTNGVYVVGGMTAFGSVALQNTATTFSDRRLKEDVTSIDLPLDKVSRLRGVRYQWKENATIGAVPLKFNDRTQFGLIAQEVQKVIPETVIHDMFGDGYLGVRYEELIPLLIEAMRELDDCSCVSDSYETLLEIFDSVEKQIIAAEEEDKQLWSLISQLEALQFS